jgi:hypothetical protein
MLLLVGWNGKIYIQKFAEVEFGMAQTAILHL